MSIVAAAPRGNPNVAILNSLQIEIKTAQDKLTKRLNEIGNIRRQSYSRIMYYIVIVLAMIFFAYIILKDLYRVLKTHEENTEVAQEDTAVSTTDDDYVYIDDTDYARRISQKLINTLEVSNDNIKTTFQPLVDFRERNKLDTKLYTRTNAHTLGPDDDTYTYDKSAGASFWSMLFERPGYYSMVNADPRNAVGA